MDLTGCEQIPYIGEQSVWYHFSLHLDTLLLSLTAYITRLQFHASSCFPSTLFIQTQLCHDAWLNDLHIWWRTQIIKFFFMHTLCTFSLTFKVFSKYHFHPQPRDNCFAAIQNHVNTYGVGKHTGRKHFGPNPEWQKVYPIFNLPFISLCYNRMPVIWRDFRNRRE
jgi:hypothetical protein